MMSPVDRRQHTLRVPGRLPRCRGAGHGSRARGSAAAARRRGQRRAACSASRGRLRACCCCALAALASRCGTGRADRRGSTRRVAAVRCLGCRLRRLRAGKECVRMPARAAPDAFRSAAGHSNSGAVAAVRSNLGSGRALFGAPHSRFGSAAALFGVHHALRSHHAMRRAYLRAYAALTHPPCHPPRSWSSPCSRTSGLTALRRWPSPQPSSAPIPAPG